MVLVMDFHPNWFRVRVQVSISNFDFEYMETPPDPKPNPWHPYVGHTLSTSPSPLTSSIFLLLPCLSRKPPLSPSLFPSRAVDRLGLAGGGRRSRRARPPTASGAWMHRPAGAAVLSGAQTHVRVGRSGCGCTGPTSRSSSARRSTRSGDAEQLQQLLG